MTTKTASSFIVNPFILNGGVWLLVFLVYQMGWSKLCAPLSTELTLFLILTIAISFAIGILSFRKYGISYSPLKSFSSKAAVLWMIFFYILFAVETVAGGGLPLLGYLSGNITVTYKEFGVPVVHVVLVNGLSCLVLYLYYAYKSFGEKKIRRNLVLLMGIGFIPFVAMFNRGAIISIILGMFIISILASKNTGRTIGKILASFLLIFFLFGLLGNLRSGKQLSKFVMQAGKATKSFYDSPFPDEFFWAYLYMATPLANVQNTIDKMNRGTGDSADLENIILYEFTPEMITKQLRGDQDKDKTYKRYRSNLRVSWLNATSVYGRPYKYMGWTGMWLMFAFTLVFIAINIRIVPKSSKWYVPMIVTLDEIVIMNLFDNMFIFMGMIPQLLIFLGIAMYSRLSNRSRYYV